MFENANNINDSTFDKIFEILEQSFEPFLYRNFENQKNLLKNKNYNIILYKENNNIIGFLSYWKLEKNIYFIEHFAIKKEFRGQGIGTKLFNEILKLDGIKILEVEPPHTEIDIKRIKLYEKLGLIFHKNLYYQPPYNKGDNKTLLNIMCTKKLTDFEFDSIVKKIYTLVYEQSYI